MKNFIEFLQDSEGLKSCGRLCMLIGVVGITVCSLYLTVYAPNEANGALMTLSATVIAAYGTSKVTDAWSIK